MDCWAEARGGAGAWSALSGLVQCAGGGQGGAKGQQGSPAGFGRSELQPREPSFPASSLNLTLVPPPFLKYIIYLSEHTTACIRARGDGESQVPAEHGAQCRVNLTTLSL